ncbi:MAG: hypothetical protein PVG14_17325 [Anaerolineales bacterium]|jgi:hypothetical protein
MESSKIRAYLNRWEAVETVEREEALSTSIEVRWRQLNALYGMALSLGIVNMEESVDEEVVRQRWATLRASG